MRIKGKLFREKAKGPRWSPRFEGRKEGWDTWGLTCEEVCKGPKTRGSSLRIHEK